MVLAGGTALRMGGVDKASLRVGGSTMLDRVLRAAAPLCQRLVVVGAPRPVETAGVVFTCEERPGGGPVPAVLAGLAAAGPADTVIVLAVDLPLLSTSGLGRLVAAMEAPGAQFPAAAAAAADDKGRPNALLAAYRADALEAARAGLTGSGASLPAARLLPAEVVVVDLGEHETLNVNTAADLVRANAAGARQPEDVTRPARGPAGRDPRN